MPDLNDDLPSNSTCSLVFDFKVMRFFWLSVMSLQKLDSCEHCDVVVIVSILVSSAATGVIAFDRMSFSIISLVRLFAFTSGKRCC